MSRGKACVAPRRPGIRPPPWRQFSDEPVTAQDVFEGSTSVSLAFPCLRDARTMAGMGALIEAFPLDWPELLQAVMARNPPVTASTRLTEALVRGTERTLPYGARAIPLAAARRSALGRLHDALPSVRLGEIDAEWLRKAEAGYQAARGHSSAIISSDLTELRATINAARMAAGLTLLPGPSRRAQSKRRAGLKSKRRVATMEEVQRLLRRSPRLLRAFIAVQLAVPAAQAHLLTLRRGEIDTKRMQITLRTLSTPWPGRPPGRLVYGLPHWCGDLLVSAIPGLKAYPDRQPIFAPLGQAAPTREAMSRAFAKVRDNAGCPHLVLSDIRRLSQSLHARAPRAVRRGTATACLSEAATLTTLGARRLANAQDDYAHEVVDTWPTLHKPPAQRRLPRRAPKGTPPESPELSFSRPKIRVAPGRVVLPASCEPSLGTKPGTGRGVMRAGGRMVDIGPWDPADRMGGGWEDPKVWELGLPDPKLWELGGPDPKRDELGRPDPKRDELGGPDPKREELGRPDPKREELGGPDPKRDELGRPKADELEVEGGDGWGELGGRTAANAGDGRGEPGELVAWTGRSAPTNRGSQRELLPSGPASGPGDAVDLWRAQAHQAEAEVSRLRRRLAKAEGEAETAALAYFALGAATGVLGGMKLEEYMSAQPEVRAGLDRQIRAMIGEMAAGMGGRG